MYASLRLPLGVRYVRMGVVMAGVGIIVLIEKVTCFELLYMLPEAVIVTGDIFFPGFAVKRAVKILTSFDIFDIVPAVEGLIWKLFETSVVVKELDASNVNVTVPNFWV